MDPQVLYSLLPGVWLCTLRNPGKAGPICVYIVVQIIDSVNVYGLEEVKIVTQSG